MWSQNFLLRQKTLSEDPLRTVIQSFSLAPSAQLKSRLIVLHERSSSFFSYRFHTIQSSTAFLMEQKTSLSRSNAVSSCLTPSMTRAGNNLGQTAFIAMGGLCSKARHSRTTVSMPTSGTPDDFWSPARKAIKASLRFLL